MICQRNSIEPRRFGATRERLDALWVDPRAVFDIAEVRGTTRTYSWSFDGIGYDVSQVYLVAFAFNGRDESCDPVVADAPFTSAILTVPETCVGRPVVVADVCRFNMGGEGQVAIHCHLYDQASSGGSSAVSPDRRRAILRFAHDKLRERR